MDNSISNLQIEIDFSSQPVVKFSGQADFYCRHNISETFDELFDEEHFKVKADMSNLEYIDSSCLSVLIRSAVKAKESGGFIEIVGISRQVSRVINLCGAASFFKSVLADVPVSLDNNCAADCDNFWHVSSFSLPGSAKSAIVARKRVEDIVRSLPFESSERMDIMIAVGEALTNAIKYGCELDSEKQIYVRCVAGSGRLVIDISDPGNGFNPDVVPAPSAKILSEGGMGIYIMRKLMDEVSFSIDSGTNVRLIKYIKVHSQPECKISNDMIKV